MRPKLNPDQDTPERSDGVARAPSQRLGLLSVLFFLLCVGFGSMGANAAVSGYGHSTALKCERPSLKTLECTYRFSRPTNAVQLAIADKQIGPSKTVTFAQTNAPHSVLFLIDVGGGPAREDAIERSTQHAQQLMRHLTDRHTLTVARFADRFDIVAPAGSATTQTKAALAALAREDKPSELYRIALKAIDYLAQQPGGQRTLLLFSDGKSDDTAYSHQDVIAAARSHQVMIYTIGYPARAGDGPVTLQTLRRLAEESAGLFIPLSPDFALPSEFAAAPLAIERSGGKSTFDLSGIGLRGDTAVTFIAGRDSVPAILPAIATPGLIRATAQGPGAGSVPAPIVDTFGMFGLVAVGGSMLLLLAFALVKRQHRPAEAPNGNVHANRDEDRGRTTQDSLEPDPPSDNGDALGTAMVTPSSSVTAYLHHQRDPTTRYALLAKTFSVGRSAENDLTLRDPSISRHHAEVRRRPDETFHVTDLDSMNGIYVNEKRVRSAPLCDGDTVEFGDVVMQFSIETEQLGAPESTDETLDTPRVTPGDIPKN